VGRRRSARMKRQEVQLIGLRATSGTCRASAVSSNLHPLSTPQATTHYTPPTNTFAIHLLAARRPPPARSQSRTAPPTGYGTPWHRHQEA
jgi:hypothetical protein